MNQSAMRYEGTIYRPPSEGRSYILQATIGCSWNKCVYCDMYREKEFRVRELADTLEDLREAARLTDHRIGLTRQTVIAIEADKYSPSLETAFKIALVFGVPGWKRLPFGIE